MLAALARRFLIGVAFVAAACSSGGRHRDRNNNNDGSNGLCAAPIDPCGGDIVGSWSLQKSCFIDFFDTCQDSVTVVKPVATTITFTANGTYSTSSSGTGTLEETMTTECKGVSTCSELDSSDFNRVCTATGDVTCKCTTTTAAGGPGSGSYTAGSNGTVVVSTASGDVTYQYCVAGSSLTMKLDAIGVIGTFTKLATD